MDEAINWMNSNFKWISFFLGLAFIGFIAWLKSKFSTRNEHMALHETVTQLKDRVGNVEAHLEHIPSKEEVHRLDKAITGLTESNNGIKAGLKKLDRKTDLLLENELREKQ